MNANNVFLSMLCFWSCSLVVADPAKPNVLFIAVDDMKDWVGCLGGYDLEADIGERRDLSEQHPKTTKALLTQLGAWRTDVGADPMRQNPEYVGAN